MPLTLEEQSFINDCRVRGSVRIATLAELSRAIVIMRSGRRLAIRASIRIQAEDEVVIDSDTAS